jgi:hypothetical protein
MDERKLVERKFGAAGISGGLSPCRAPATTLGDGGSGKEWLFFTFSGTRKQRVTSNVLKTV